MVDDLAGLPAVVTGSSRGLGRAFAQAVAQAGAHVVVNGTDPDATQAVVDAITSEGGTAIPCVGSVTDAAFCAQLIETCVEEFGGIGLLVNNAGVTRDRSLTRMSVEEFDEVVAVHLRGTWACGAAAARAMRKSGGSIVNVTSGAGLFGTFGQANYAAAKAGIIGLSRVMDLELARHGIRVNTLAPVARTNMTAVFDTGTVAHRLPFPPPETVAPLVTYLASDAGRHLHGQVLSFDGTELSVWSHPAATSTWTQTGGWTIEAFGAALTPETMQHPNPDRWGSGIVAG
ncbi:SDR family NAD(P)-dependent oxidoreductase [Dactylosporangium sp. AC04546]|uniref:SDR family NAD(P)-dependent oxidoreductase n=1 Tax=Dactylosporangium sp. AC04546 TaxID=2862460 RepID=UPI001EDFC3C6|nr:SDR family NAD(P)-dependent oxidoreductase [Dactylosporangium sp. AC04546]WVK86855.1 SDR family NAD(P)-dependent oxidoreductase [Dactylosporangium sp. AC04546]